MSFVGYRSSLYSAMLLFTFVYLFKFDQGLSRLMHQELHWLDIPERVNYKLGVLTHRCLLGIARRQCTYQTAA